jgi:protein gp37
VSTTTIEWTETTWNPVTGCSKISPGCLNCYAERMAKRLQAMGQPNYRDGFAVRTHEHMLRLPYSWSKPRMVFVNSMGDLFHEEVTIEFIKTLISLFEK